MKPTLLLLVRTETGEAAALAEVARRRAGELAIACRVVAVAGQGQPELATSQESVTAVVPVEFAGAHHEAWCLLCQLSLHRRSVEFAILVLGAATSTEFRARQRALVASARPAPAKPRPRRRAA